MGLRLASAIWGLAEATLFFLVPDVLLSAIALRDRGLALRCCVWALSGALAGGALMFLAAAGASDAAVTAVGHVPGVTGEMLTRVESGLDELGSWAMFLGPLTGTPYKIYAVTSPAAGIELWWFLLVSVPARVIRFVVVALMASFVSATVLRNLSYRRRLSLLLGFWAVFYTAYFTVLT
ncbi:hypothetical protein [Halostreptopolyspora alba]|uniref:DedA family protein n=1 Tax=Halostreptopolyspora alba TaxID=2487137 RepID=A0A3N0EBR5_9ACTN|nr:hypothetical protein EFW17_09500 [Nocardiopsaceae bacterium YIM 96095]